MAVRGLINNFRTTLAEPVADSDTSFDVADATGLSAELALSDYVPLTIQDGDDVEIMYCTGVSTNTLTVSRGKEGTTALNFSAGIFIECRPTKELYKEAGGFELVKSITLGASATEVEFTFDSGSYLIRIDGAIVDGLSDPELSIQQKNSGGYRTSGYDFIRNIMAGGTNTPSSSTSQSNIEFINNATRGSSAKISGDIIVETVEESEIHAFYCNIWQRGALTNTVGWNTTGEALTGCKLISNLSNGWRSGSKFYMFKIKG